jgi:hypothetical protein
MNNNRKNNKMTSKETMKTIQQLDNQEWENMKNHIDKTFPEMKLPTMKDFKEFIKLWGSFQIYKSKKLN